MTKHLMVTLSAVVAMTACGPGAKVGGGKQGAAQALHAASAPTEASANRSATPVDLTGDVTWTCPHGGTALLSGFQSVSDPGSPSLQVVQRFTVTYQQCGLAKSEAGIAVYGGSLLVDQKVEVSDTGVSVAQKLKGKVTLQGAFDDFLDADVEEQVRVGDLAGSGGSVQVKLNGSLVTGSGSFQYDGSSIDVLRGALPAALPQ